MSASLINKIKKTTRSYVASELRGSLTFRISHSIQNISDTFMITYRYHGMDPKLNDRQINFFFHEDHLHIVGGVSWKFSYFDDDFFECIRKAIKTEFGLARPLLHPIRFTAV